MTPRPVLAVVGGAAFLVAGAVAVLASTTLDYFANPVAVSSTSGNRVFRVGGELVAYPGFVMGAEPVIVGAALAVLSAALVLAAVTWRPAQRS